jgi:pimeloyl-ACP methyl ester carboxylesterase
LAELLFVLGEATSGGGGGASGSGSSSSIGSSSDSNKKGTAAHHQHHPIDLVGYSMGGTIAAHFTALHGSSKVRSFVGVAPAGSQLGSTMPR